MENKRVVSQAEWLAERKRLLAQEKSFTRMRDELAAARRTMPWVKVEKHYEFQGLNGAMTLADLFGESRQLIVYHFMLAPGADQGCFGCSFVADHLQGPLLHLQHRDVALAAVSRAPINEIENFRQRMGWDFTWVSSFDTDFNQDFDVSFLPQDVERGDTTYNFEVRADQSEGEAPGASVFYRDSGGDSDGEVFHTYSCYARGLEDILGTYVLLDLTPVGRNESSPMEWVRLHDSYE